MKYLQSYYSDIGVKRKENQDSLSVLKAITGEGEILLAVLCDGMGGYQAGEIASQTIVEAFETWFRKDCPRLVRRHLSFEILQRQWEQLLKDCNQKLVDLGRKYEGNVGSTVTAILFYKDEYYVGHVGDSRAYIVGPENVYQITQDQSVVAEEVRQGIITEQEAIRDRRRNVLLECVGVTEQLNIEFYTGPVLPGMFYLLCSDGMWHYLKEEDYTTYLAGNLFEDNRTIRMHLNFLFEQVKERGEQDNISAIGIIPVPEKEVNAE